MSNLLTNLINNLWEKGGIVTAQCDPYGKSEFTLVVSADKPGLMSLAKVLLYLGEFPDGSQIVLRPDGSIPFISNMPVRVIKVSSDSEPIKHEIFWDEALLHSAIMQLESINHALEKSNELPPSRFVERMSVVGYLEEGYYIRAQKVEAPEHGECVNIIANLRGLRTLSGYFLRLAKYQECPPSHLDRLNGLNLNSNVWLVLRRLPS